MAQDENKAKYEARPWIKWYLEGVSPDITVEEKSVVDTFNETTEQWKDKTALVFYGRKMSFKEVRDQVDRFATALHDMGVKKGDKIALLLLNSPQFVIAYMGALKAGATLTAISPVYVSSEIKYQLEDSGARMIVCLDILYDNVERSGVKLDAVILTSIGEYLPAMKKFLGSSVLRAVYQKMAAPPVDLFEREGVYRFQDLIKKYPPNPPETKFNIREDIVTLPYTGGTTGQPKGAVITHYNFGAARELADGFWGDIVQKGYTSILITTPDPDDILTAVDNYKGTIFYGVPSLYEYLRDYEKTNRVNWKKIKVLISGADALLEETARGWEKRTDAPIHEGWGMTETTSTGMVSPYGRPKIGSFGVPMPGCVAAIVEAEGTKFLPVGETGELVFKGPNVFKGYWQKPEATKEVFLEVDGETWLRTGDLAKMDEEGYFYFYDRKKDMIKYKGLQVFAREVEEVLTSHPQVKEAGVIGVPDPDVGERVKAIVVLESEARGKVSEEEIMKYCAGKISAYMVPKIIEFRGEVPKTDVGKVSRRELREEEL
jgi:long-chain acyl-CoA synthetase